MSRSAALTAPLLFVSLTSLLACGPAPAASAPPAASASPDASAAPASSVASGAPEAADSAAPTASAAPAASAAPDAKPAAASSEAATLAHDLVKGGGRRIGWSASKKSFVYPVEHRSETSYSLDLQFLGDDGKPGELMRVCQPGECAEQLDPILKEMLPKLTARLEQDGYSSIRSIGWTAAGEDLEVSSLDMHLHYTRGRIEGRNNKNDKKPPVVFTAQGKHLDTNEVEAIFVVPDTKLLAAFAKPTGKTNGLVQELYVLKRP